MSCWYRGAFDVMADVVKVGEPAVGVAETVIDVVRAPHACSKDLRVVKQKGTERARKKLRVQRNEREGQQWQDTVKCEQTVYQLRLRCLRGKIRERMRAATKGEVPTKRNPV